MPLGNLIVFVIGDVLLDEAEQVYEIRRGAKDGPCMIAFDEIQVTE